MKKCVRCGNVAEDDISICINCGHDLTIQKETKPKKLIKAQPQSKTDLIDYPILSFLFGIISLIIPIYLFSILAISTSKKPSKPSLEAMSRLGKIFGYLGILISTFLIGYLFYVFIIK